MSRSPLWRSALEQAAQLALELVEARQHAAGGVLDAGDVVAGLAPGVGPQLGGARPRPPRGSAAPARRRRPPAATRRARRAARPRSASNSSATRRRWLVDGLLVVAAAADREVAALDGVSVHALRIVTRSRPLSTSMLRKCDGSVTAAHHEPVALERGERALAPLGGQSGGQRLAREQGGDDAPARPAVAVLEPLGAAARRRGGAGPPAARVAQPSRTGQSPQRGARGRQTVAPSSIIAWLNVGRPPGRAAAPRARSASAAGARATGVETLDHAPHVGVDRRRLAIPGERADRGRRVRADAGQLGQVVRPAALGDLRAPRPGAPARGGCSRARSRPRARRAAAPPRAPRRPGSARGTPRSTGRRAPPASAGASPR